MIKTAPSILKTIVLILILFSLSLIKVTSISAQSASGISAIPPRLELTVQPDGINTQVIKVRNESNQKQVITTELQDFIVQDNQGTPVIIDDQDQETNRWAASTWIQVSPTTLELKPGREYQFRYLIDGRQWENDWHADKYVQSPIGDSENSVVVV